MKHYIKITVLILIIVFLTGCRDRMEIENITFPVALGIDINEANGKIKIYAQVTSTSFQGGGPGGGPAQAAKNFKVVEGEGDSLFEAMYTAVDHSEQYISWKHVVAVIVTEKLARHGLGQIMDLLSRFEEIRMNSYLIVTDVDLKDLLDSTPEVEISVPTPLASIQMISQQNGNTEAATLRDYYMSNFCEGREPVIPRVTIFEKHGKDIKLDYIGIGAFKKDRLAGWLDEDETKRLLILTSSVNIGSMTIPYTDDSRNKVITLKDLTYETKIIPLIQENRVVVKVKTRVEYNLAETTVLMPIDDEGIKKINSLVQSNIKTGIEAVIRKAQKDLKTDILRFGEKIYMKYPGYWKENKEHWPEIFPNIEASVEVDANLRLTGEITQNLLYKPGKD